MRMSSTVKKGKSQPSNSNLAALPLSKDGSAAKTINSKVGETKHSDSSRDQLNPKLLPTAEQLRIAQMISDSKRDDPELPEKVNKLVELTNCSSDAAIIALHDSNNDLDQAIAALLDGESEADVWEVSGKKKKPKQLTPQSGGSEGTEIGTNNGTGASGSGGGGGRGRDRERSRSTRGGPPRLRAGRGRGGRDNKENVEDENGADAFVGSSSRGRGSRSGPRMSNGPGRGSGRGRGGSNSGAQRRGPRSNPSDVNWDDGLTNVEPWRGPEAVGANSEFPSADEWDNEEYIGSLVETKVFTPSSSTLAAPPVEQPSLPNGSVPVEQQQQTSCAPPPQVHYSSGAAGQGIDLNALLQKTSGVTLAGSSSLQQQFLGHHYSNQQQATDALKAAMGVGSSSASKSAKPLRSKIPPPSKIPSSAVEMPDDSSVIGLDVKFGTLDFGIGQSGFDMSGLDISMMPTSSSASSNSHGLSSKPSDHQQQQQHNHHSLMSSTKMDQYGSGEQQQQPPAPSSLPKPDPSLGGFSSAGSSVSSAQSMQQSSSAPSQVKTANSTYTVYGGSSYVSPGVSSSQTASSAGSQPPAGAYPSTTAGVYNSGTTSSAYQGSQNSAYVSYAQQQQQPSTNYQGYNNKMNADASNSSVSSSALGLPGSTSSRSGTAASTATGVATKPVAATQVGSSQAAGVPNLPPGVPTMLGPGGFIMGQAPGLPYYAAAAGIQQHPVYSLEDMQYRYPHLAAGYYDMGYGQSPTSLGTGREGTLASLAYATGSDAKFSRNENNSPVPTSLSQNAAQSHGGAFITPAAAAPTPLTPAYAYYYSGGVMPGSYQFGAPAALYPVSAAASGHASGAGNPVNQYGKTGASGTAGSQSSGQVSQVASSSGGNASSAGVGAQSNAGGGTSSGGYASYGSTYDEFSKSVYGSVSAGGQAAKMGGGSGGPSSATSGAELSYGKTHQLGKINTYDKAGAFHTGTPPPYGLSGNASGAPLGVGVSVGVGGPSPYGGQHMFIPTLAPHQSQHSHLMHQQLHQDSNSGPGQRSQTGGQQNKQGSKPSYGGSYWGSN